MRASRTYRFVRYLTLVTLVIGSGCGKRTRRTHDDTLVFVLPDLLRDLDPRFAITNYDTKVSRLIAPGLTSVDNPTAEPLPLLAETIERVSDTEWRVTLKPGLHCSDGTPLSARDVAWTYQTILAKDSKSLFQKPFQERFSAVEALDERTTRFVLLKPLATFQSDIEFGILCERTLQKGELVGAGPYRLQSHSEQEAVLEPNPFYGGPRPPLKARFVVVRDGNARALMLAGGSADLTQNSVRIDLVNELIKRDRLRMQTGPSSLLTFLMMQNEDPALKDRRVRQAIAHAIDREAIVRAKFHGYAVLATGLLPPGHWAYEPEVARYGYDPDKARALLDQAGLRGQPRLKLVYKTSSDPFRVTVARLIAEQLGRVGIEVEVRSFEFGTFFADVKKGNFQLASLQSAEIGEPDYFYTYYHSSRIPSEKDQNVHNRYRFRNARVDELTEAGRAENDRARRRQIYGEVQKILADELPVIPLWHEDNIAVMNKDVSGYQLWPNARLSGLVGAKKK